MQNVIRQNIISSVKERRELSKEYNAKEFYRISFDDINIETDKQNQVDGFAEKLKNEFLAQLSHEIRTPLNIVLNYVSLLKEVVNLERTEHLDNIFKIIQNSGKRLERTIDSLILMSQLKSNTFKISPQQVNIKNDVIRPLLDEYRVKAKEKGIGLYLNDDTCGGINIDIDLFSIRTIMENVLDNAIKYTHIGLVEITISCENSKGVILVKDTGIGIRQESIMDLCKPFKLFEEVYTRKYDGNGLGLAIVKYLCELNNMELLLSSSKQSGTVFKLILNN